MFLGFGLPAAFLLPLLIGRPFGPVLHMGGPGSARYLDLWAVLSILAALIVVAPAARAAYRWRGPWVPVLLVLWLGVLVAISLVRGVWYS